MMLIYVLLDSDLAPLGDGWAAQTSPDHHR